jgi:uncharacterized phage-associated protein
VLYFLSIAIRYNVHLVELLSIIEIDRPVIYKGDTQAMAVSIYRKKLINATMFFAQKTKNVNLTKLSKLLYFLDFEHFEQTGYPCIGLKYYSFKNGPVPRTFWLEIKDGVVPDDFKGKLALIAKVDENNPSFKEITIKAIADPDLSIFSPREINLLKKLADIFRDAKAKDMSEVSHVPRQPWDITIKQSGENQYIDYCLCIGEKSKIKLNEARETLREHFETVENLNIAPTK